MLMNVLKNSLGSTVRLLGLSAPSGCVALASVGKAEMTRARALARQTFRKMRAVTLGLPGRAQLEGVSWAGDGDLASEL